MDAAVCSVKIRFIDQDYFRQPFDSYDSNHVEYSEKENSLEACMEGVFRYAFLTNSPNGPGN